MSFKILIKTQIYIYRAHKLGHHRHPDAVCENAKFGGSLLYMDIIDDTKKLKIQYVM